MLVLVVLSWFMHHAGMLLYMWILWCVFQAIITQHLNYTVLYVCWWWWYVVCLTERPNCRHLLWFWSARLFGIWCDCLETQLMPDRRNDVAAPSVFFAAKTSYTNTILIFIENVCARSSNIKFEQTKRTTSQHRICENRAFSWIVKNLQAIKPQTNSSNRSSAIAKV